MGQGFDLIAAERQWVTSSPALYCYRVDPQGRVRSDLDFFKQKQIAWGKLAKSPRYSEPRARYRIGRRYENHLQSLFEADGSLVAQNISITDTGGRTAGELDFILSDGAGSFLHWESSVKFYLANYSGTWPALVGPNARDTLYNKMKKSLRSQNLRGFTPDGRRALHEYLQGGSLSASVSVMQGYFFYPVQDKKNRRALAVNPAAPGGWWTELDRLKLDPSPKYCLWPKRYWLAPAALPLSGSSDYGLVMTAAELTEYLREYFRYQRRAQMVLTLKQAATGYVETGRGFVVHPDWPYFAA